MKTLLILCFVPLLAFGQSTNRQEKAMGNATTTWAQKKPSGTVGLTKMSDFLLFNDATGATDTIFVSVQYDGSTIDTATTYRHAVLPGEQFGRRGRFDAVWVRSESGNNPYRLIMIKGQ